jgi:hypothetical protein
MRKLIALASPGVIVLIFVSVVLAITTGIRSAAEQPNLSRPVGLMRFTPPPGWTPPPIYTPTPGPSATPVPAVAQESYTLKDSDPACMIDPNNGQPWPRTVKVPVGSTVVCYRQTVSDYIRTEVVAGRLAIGANGVCRGRIGTDLDSCLESAFSQWVPVVYGMTPRFIPQLGLCAAGVTWNESIQISLAQDWRTLGLVAWEHANHLVVVKLDRYDLGDGSFTGGAHSAAVAACPVP